MPNTKAFELARRLACVATEAVEPKNLPELKILVRRLGRLIDREFDDAYLEEVRVCHAEIAIELATM